MAELNRGSLYRCESLPKNRPVLVMTRQQAIPLLNHVTVVPTTSTIREIPTEVLLQADQVDVRKNCVLACDHVTTVKKTSLGTHITDLPENYLREVMRSIRFALGFPYE